MPIRGAWIGRVAAAAISAITMSVATAPAAPRPPPPDRTAVGTHESRVAARLATSTLATATDRQLLAAAQTYLARSRSALAAGSLVPADQYAAASDDLATAINPRSQPPPHGRPHGPRPDGPVRPPRLPRPPDDGVALDPAELTRTIDRVSTTLETVSNVIAAPGSVERMLTATASKLLDDARLQRANGDDIIAVRDARSAEAIARATLHVALAKNPTDAVFAEPGPPDRPHRPRPPGDRPPPDGRP